MRIYLFIAAVAGGVTYLLTPLIRHIAIEIGAVGEVRARDVHTVPTPRMGDSSRRHHDQPTGHGRRFVGP